MGNARAVGIAAIAVAVAFNAPYATLASIFNYPGVLRQPAGEVLELFAAGGPGLVLTWYAFMLVAMAFVPLAIALAVTPERLRSQPGLAIGAAGIGALAGLTQAIGLSRWVFVIPGLAAAHSDPNAAAGTAEAAERAFELLNLYGGVAIGEHIGQMLTGLFMLAMGLMQLAEQRRITGGMAVGAAALLLLGTGEGIALALGADGGLFSIATIVGFLGLSAWLAVTGVAMIRGSRVHRIGMPLPAAA
jgi:hypothetical protein